MGFPTTRHLYAIALDESAIAMICEISSCSDAFSRKSTVTKPLRSGETYAPYTSGSEHCAFSCVAPCRLGTSATSRPQSMASVDPRISFSFFARVK